MDNQVKNPRNHQKEAIIASLQCDKGKVILPTGTGKTLVESDIIRGLIEQDSDCANGVYVIVAPRILLAYQNLTNVAERLTKHNIQCKYLNVNSGSFNDATLNRCIDGLGLQAYNIESTTDFSEISRIYGICFNKKMPLVISCTYHSANQIQKSRIPVNAYLFDEAHYLADNGRFHEATRYQSTRKYFFTATPRTTEDVTSGSGMDNEARYGTTIYTKSPKEMIEAGEMVKPAIHLVGVVGNSAPVDGEIDDYSANYDYKNISNAIISSFFEHSDAVRKYAAFPDRIGAKFLVTLEGQRSLKGVWDSVEFQQFMVANPHIHVFALSTDFGVAINGKRYKNSNNSKEILFAAVQSLKSTDQAIMMHVDMLSEGIDVPGITGVMPFRNFGKIKFLQNTGRSTRLFGDEGQNFMMVL